VGDVHATYDHTTVDLVTGDFQLVVYIFHAGDLPGFACNIGLFFFTLNGTAQCDFTIDRDDLYVLAVSGN
jgi:hypothetical protein